MAAKEVCIAARDFGPGRAQEGDIIAIRDPQTHIGLREGNDFIWGIMNEEDLPTGELRGSSNKFRYNIPLDRVKVHCEEADLDRVRDPSKFYQPVCDVDSRTGRYTRQNIPISLPTIVTDKESV